MSHSIRLDARAAKIGMLVWSLPVRVLDVSRGGCGVELDRPVPAGTSGRLEIEFGGVVHADDVRICRSQARAGAGEVRHLGVELLRTRPLSQRSLRFAVGRIVGEPDADFLEVADPAAALDRREERRKKGVTRSPPLAAIADT